MEPQNKKNNMMYMCIENAIENMKNVCITFSPTVV